MVWYGWWKEDTILTAASLVQCGRREGGGGAGFQNLSRPHKAFNLRVKGNVAFWSQSNMFAYLGQNGTERCIRNIEKVEMLFDQQEVTGSQVLHLYTGGCVLICETNNGANFPILFYFQFLHLHEPHPLLFLVFLYFCFLPTTFAICMSLIPPTLPPTHPCNNVKPA